MWNQYQLAKSTPFVCQLSKSSDNTQVFHMIIVGTILEKNKNTEFSRNMEWRHQTKKGLKRRTSSETETETKKAKAEQETEEEWGIDCTRTNKWTGLDGYKWTVEIRYLPHRITYKYGWNASICTLLLTWEVMWIWH